MCSSHTGCLVGPEVDYLDENKVPITPEKFRSAMKKILEDNKVEVYIGTELAHIQMDDLMCEVLSSLDYDEGVKIFKDIDTWYA